MMERWTDQMICDLCENGWKYLPHPGAVCCHRPMIVKGRRIEFHGHVLGDRSAIPVRRVLLSIRAIRRYHLLTSKRLVMLVAHALKALEKRALEIAG